MNKLEKFIQESVKIHGDKYIYNKVEYKTNRTKVIITCKIHGDFLQLPHNHLFGKGCQSCGKNKKIDINSFIERSNHMHKGKYNYELVDYINSESKVKIICPDHGIFEQSPIKHINGSGCFECGGSVKLTNEKFISKSNEKHNFKYDYSLVDYKNNNTKVKIICKKHGEFEQLPFNHLKGVGCMICSGKKKLTNQEFINRSNDVHNFKYDYSITNYINNKSDVEIICKKHGKFTQKACYHLTGHGCQNCTFSKMEDYVENFLKNNNFIYQRQFIFEDLKDKGHLKFDFAMFDENNILKYLLEYNGEQHYIFKGHFGMKREHFEGIQRRDKLKIEYCKNKKIDLKIIKYDQEIDLELNELLNY